MKKYIYILLFTILYCNNVFAIDKNYISSVAHSTKRTVVSLNGNWERIVKNAQAEKHYVPFTDYEKEKVTYKKSFVIDKATLTKQIFYLQFLGLAGQVEVYVNDNFIIKIDGNFQPTVLRLPTKKLRAGQNMLTLVFLEETHIEQLQSLATINAPKRAKGIVRNVYLIGTSQIYINDFKYNINGNSVNFTFSCLAEYISQQLVSKDEETGTLAADKTRIVAEFQLFSNTTNQAITPILSKSFSIENQQIIDISASLNANYINAWSPDSPELYKLIITLKKNGEIIDEYSTNIGKCKVSKKKNEILINGIPTTIRAIAYHEYFGNVGYTLSNYRLEEDVKSIKLLGANAIRIPHISPNPYFIELCNKYGLMVMIDMPLHNTHNGLLANNDIQTTIKNIAIKTIQAYKNAPSFIGIGIGDNVQEGNDYLKITETLSEIIHKAGRITYRATALKKDYSDEANIKSDILLLKTNKRFNSPDDIKNALKQAKSEFDAPIILFAAKLVQPNNRNGYSDPNSIEAQSHFIKYCFDVTQSEKIAGLLYQSFNDYATEFPVLKLNYYNSKLNTDGVVDIYRDPRTSLNMLKALFTDERTPLLSSGNYTETSPVSFIISGLLSILAVLVMLQRNKRFREYFARSFLRSFNFFSDIRDKRILPIMQTLAIYLIISIAVGVSISALLFACKDDIAYTFLLNAILPNEIITLFYKAVWAPEILAIILAFLFALLPLINAVTIKIITYFKRLKYSFADTLTTSIWAAQPFLILVPVSAILLKLIALTTFASAAFYVLFAVLVIWSYCRFFRAVAILLNSRPNLTYIIGTLIVVTAFAIGLIVLQSSSSIINIISYFNYLQ